MKRRRESSPDAHREEKGARDVPQHEPADRVKVRAVLPGALLYPKTSARSIEQEDVQKWANRCGGVRRGGESNTGSLPENCPHISPFGGRWMGAGMIPEDLKACPCTWTTQLVLKVRLNSV